MLEEASGCKTWLSGYLGEAFGCLYLPNPETAQTKCYG